MWEARLLVQAPKLGQQLLDEVLRTEWGSENGAGDRPPTPCQHLIRHSLFKELEPSREEREMKGGWGQIERLWGAAITAWASDGI